MKRFLIVVGIIMLSACSGMGKQYGSSGNSYSSGSSSGMASGSSGPGPTSQFYDNRHSSPSDPYFGG